MKRKIGDFTLAEIKRTCAKHETCLHCPFTRKDPSRCSLSKYWCLVETIMTYPYEMNLDAEVEIEEEKNEKGQ